MDLPARGGNRVLRIPATVLVEWRADFDKNRINKPSGRQF